MEASYPLDHAGAAGKRLAHTASRYRSGAFVALVSLVASVLVVVAVVVGVFAFVFAFVVVFVVVAVVVAVLVAVAVVIVGLWWIM